MLLDDCRRSRVTWRNVCIKNKEREGKKKMATRLKTLKSGKVTKSNLFA